MNIGVLTSSRADYGIYRPLLEKLSADLRFNLIIIAFGMHLLERHGQTITEIERDSFGTILQVAGMPDGDSRLDIVRGYGEVVKNFGDFWNEHQFDCVLVLGDRWEMSAAVQAAIPFEIKLAHIHGGETTLGATDNIYRHQITLASCVHFTAAEVFSQRVSTLIASDTQVYTVGSISLEGLTDIQLPDWNQVKQQFDIPFEAFILVTFHPESVNAEANKDLAEITYNALSALVEKHALLITKANADVMGTLFNEKLEALEKENPNRVRLVASLGKLNYFSAMRECEFLLGNTSSGIIEAASFNKWVINVGDRQKGRLQSGNVINVPFNADGIIESVVNLSVAGAYTGENKYVSKKTIDKIIDRLLDL